MSFKSIRIPAVLLFLGLMAFSPTFAQKSQGKEIGLDTVRLSYHFTPGQKITYRVVSYDSVELFAKGKHKIIRERVETVQFECDSVVSDGYAMTTTTTGHASTQYLDSLGPLVHDTHPWVDRRISFVMAPDGKRLRLLGISDSTTPGVAPGAPFQPLLLPYIGGETTFIGSSGAFPVNQLMVDNVYPPVELKNTMFRVVSGRVDTLDQKCVRIGMTDVGKVQYALAGPDNGKVVTTTVLNGGGEYYFAPGLGYMAGGHYALVGQIALATTDKQEGSGRQILSMIYELVEGEE